MLVISGSRRLNYGFGYPDINYAGNSVVDGPFGLGGLTDNPLLLIALAAGAYYFLRKR